MSPGNKEDVSMITGRRLSWGCFRIQERTSRPEILGSLISSRTQEGGLAAALDKVDMALWPSVATSSLAETLAFRNAMAVRTTSSGLSSTWSILVSILGKLRGRQIYPESAPHAGPRLHADTPTHALGSFSNQGKSDPGAGVGLVIV